MLDLPTQQRDLLEAMAAGRELDDDQALQLAEIHDTAALARTAAKLRDQGFGDVMTYSRKVFLPLTHLCRDVCHYCTFAQTPRHLAQPYLSVEQVLEEARRAEQAGCREALLTLGEKPELRYRVAREALAELGFATTLEYVAHVAGEILAHTSLLPHINAGCMTADELAMLRPVSASMGIMLESASERLCEKGMPHHGSPDKHPAVRLATIEEAGRARVPFTSGILVGIGETRRERIESLLALRAAHRRHGHLQEIIVQNFRAKPDTLMASAPEPSLDELLWSIAVARLIFGPEMSLQAPPNLSPGVLEQLVAAGINDWGGVSPLTPDYVNPEAPWPHLDQLAQASRAAGRQLAERLTIYPGHLADRHIWLDEGLQTRVLQQVGADGLPRRDDWMPGADTPPPAGDLAALAAPPMLAAVDAGLQRAVARASAGHRLDESELARLFLARGDSLGYLCQAADALRAEVCGDEVGYVVNRNINYTNICYFKCQFCAFSKGKLSENLRGRPYDLSAEEIHRRVTEAWQRGATEVCMQGGIHPEYTGQTYLDILQQVKTAQPGIHVHAFSPLEVWQGAKTLGLPLADYLQALKEAGLGSLPGTAAEILDDEVRAVLCPDKLGTEDWLTVMRTAHSAGLRSTATIMYGHMEQPHHWARHLLRIRDLQQETGGFTEFVPLPFVAMEAPLYLKGQARRGPTFREAMLMHAVARLVLHTQIANIQTSWVKMGEEGVAACLRAGANDLGGTLMNESITRAAGAAHGEEMPPERMEALITRLGRRPRQRTTLYGEAAAERVATSFGAQPVTAILNTPARRYERDGQRRELVRRELADD